MQAKNAENFAPSNLLIFQQTRVRKLFSPTSDVGTALRWGNREGLVDVAFAEC